MKETEVKIKFKVGSWFSWGSFGYAFVVFVMARLPEYLQSLKEPAMVNQHAVLH